jgi:hypothetical protein
MRQGSEQRPWRGSIQGKKGLRTLLTKPQKFDTIYLATTSDRKRYDLYSNDV